MVALLNDKGQIMNPIVCKIIQDAIADCMETMVQELAFLHKVVDETKLDEDTRNIYTEFQIQLGALATSTDKLQKCLKA